MERRKAKLKEVAEGSKKATVSTPVLREEEEAVKRVGRLEGYCERGGLSA